VQYTIADTQNEVITLCVDLWRKYVMK